MQHSRASGPLLERQTPVIFLPASLRTAVNLAVIWYFLFGPCGLMSIFRKTCHGYAINVRRRHTFILNIDAR